MERFHHEEKYKRIKSEGMGYQHKDKKTKQFIIKSSSSFEVYGDSYN